MDRSAGFNPYKIKLAYLLRAQQAFGVKVLPLMKKVESFGDDGIDVDKLELEELLTFVFLALDMNEKQPTKDTVLEMDVEELYEAMGASEEVVRPDPI